MQIILGETNDRNFEALYLQIRVAHKHETFHKYILLFTVTETTCLIKILSGKVEYIFEISRHFMGVCNIHQSLHKQLFWSGLFITIHYYKRDLKLLLDYND